MSCVVLQEVGLAYENLDVLIDVSLTVEHGSFFVVIGPNGAGKTSLLKVLCRLCRPGRGTVRVLGQELDRYDRSALARRVAYVAQQAPYYLPFTVHETVLLGRSPHLGLLGLEKQSDHDIARQAMRFTGISHLADRRLNQISGGELQRTMIAKAICQQPEIILLDEPTAALDLAHQTRIMDLMEQLRQEQGTTVIMVSHDLNLAAMYGQTLALMVKGRVAAAGEPQQVLEETILQHAYGCRLTVSRHPGADVPLIVPLPAKFKTNSE